MWLLDHIIWLIPILVVLLYVQIFWTTNGTPWRRRWSAFVLVTLLLAYPLHAIWVGGGVEPSFAKRPFIMQVPRPTEDMVCFVNTITNQIDSCRLDILEVRLESGDPE